MKVWKSLSTLGLLTATLFFAFSLTPSLLPRTEIVQGLVSGVSLAAGYGVGAFVRWFWSYLELPVLNGRRAQFAKLAAAAACGVVAGVFLWQASGWQNSIRELMELEPVDTARPYTVGVIALAVFAVILVISKLFRMAFLIASHWLNRFVPRRISNVAGALAVFLLVWSLVEGVLMSSLLRAVDSSFQQIDARIEADIEPPVDPLKTGSPNSLVAWEDIGREGRGYIVSGPTADEIGEFLGEPALEPIRVYVGLNSAETIEERARLALQELLRVGAFERSALIITTPTGTGWIDPAAMNTVEYLHRGDIASVALQYSYLPSVLSLLIEPDYGDEAARVLFAEIYGYWRELPTNGRPNLYLYGLSLGALNSSQSFDIFDVVGNLFQGALWSGPPYSSEGWRSATSRRNARSPAWLPRFRDSSIIRFMNQHGGLDIPGVPWGPMRIGYLQYASDPVVFFDPQILFMEPDWMAHPRGPDVSPMLRWYPIVTALQLVADMIAGETAPVGYGHRYAAEHYIDAWVAITRPEGWTGEDTSRLKELFSERMPR